MLRLATPDGPDLEVAPARVIVAGFAGRDRAAVEAHIAELAAIGVPPPPSVPCFYRVSAGLVGTAARVQVLGGDSSGEAEPVVIADAAGRLWLGVGSDHTDRRVEAWSIPVAKQACAKPIAPAIWPLDEVAGDWDRLELRAWATVSGRRTLYQDGTLAELTPPDALIAAWAAGAGGAGGAGVGGAGAGGAGAGALGAGDPGPVAGLPPETVLFCGTVPVTGGVRPATAFEIELHDPRRGRSLGHAYTVDALPWVA